MNNQADRTDSERRLTRRDWFRLRRPASSQAAARPRKEQLLGEEQTRGLQPTEQPPNHDGMDLSELPPMHEALLTTDQVADLFADLAACATDVRLQTRRRAPDGDLPSTLQHARERLLSGELPRLQIRYRWQESHWIDTLEHRSDGIRLVRIRHAERS